jgi:GTP pyrophosphokinase
MLVQVRSSGHGSNNLAELLQIQDIIDKVRTYHSNADVDLIQKAFVLAADVHEGQTRRSGEPYLMHPIAVAKLCAELRLDEHAVCAAILHDTVEDTETTLEQVNELFGPTIGRLVDGLTKLSKIQFNSSEERQAENFRKMIVAMSRDIRVILVKLADRLHNMRTLEHLNPEKQKRIARETLDIYAPLANRLGINAIKQELEDLSFRYNWPHEYRILADKIHHTRKSREQYTKAVNSKIEDLMKSYELTFDVSGRPKHLYSIWQKMLRQGIDFEHVYDLIGFRIITDSVKNCYQALGLIHMTWRPIPGRFKDYIALPKANNYRSLHTAVIGPSGQRIEVQIRTNQMHEVAEHGVAAHWAYKEGQPGGDPSGKGLNWLKQLMEWQRELKDPEDFLDTLKLDLFVADVYVFTPNGDLKVLPRGSTPVDFAYSIHSEVGDRCAGSLVNGRMVQLNYHLRNGDMVEVRTKKGQTPNPDWLRFVRTGRAKNRIRAHQRDVQRTAALSIGREVLNKELKKYNLTLAKVSKGKRLVKVAESMNVRNAEDLIAYVGTQKLQLAAVIRHLLTPEEHARGSEQKESMSPASIVTRLTEGVRKRLKSPKSGICVDGLSDILVRTAKCCQPIPGDKISGIITSSSGVSIHIKDCPNIITADADRTVQVYWDKDGGTFPTWIRVLCEDTHGKLADMGQIFSNRKINILKASCNTKDSDLAVNDFEVVVRSTDQLEHAIAALRNLPGVVSVERLRSS